QSFQVQFASGDRRCEISTIGSLLPAESDFFEPYIRELEESLRRQRLNSTQQTVICGASRLERDLLLEDDVNQRVKALFAFPQRRRPVTLDNHCESCISFRKYVHCSQQ